MYAHRCEGITEAGVGRTGLTAPEQLVAVFGLNDETCCGHLMMDIELRRSQSWHGTGPQESSCDTPLPQRPSFLNPRTRGAGGVMKAKEGIIDP